MSQPTLNPLEIKDLINQYHSDLRKLEYQVHKTKLILEELEKQAAGLREALAGEEVKAKTAARAKAPKAAPAAESKPEKEKKRPGRPRKAAQADETKAEAPAIEPEAKAAAAAPTPETQAPAAKRTPRKRITKKVPAESKKKPGRPPKSDEEKKSAKASKKESGEKQEAGYRLSDWDDLVINCLKTKQKALITSDFVDIAKENPDIKSGEAQIKVKLNRSLHKLSNKKGLLVKVEHAGRGFAYALNEWLNNKGELPKKYAH